MVSSAHDRYNSTRRIGTGLKRSALAIAMGICFSAGVQAQSNTAGAVTGHAEAGDRITVSNPDTGFSRTISVEENGNYRFSALPVGTYTVSRNGGVPRRAVVNVGSAVSVDFVGDGVIDIDTMVVTGTGGVAPIDVSSVGTSTILTAEQINSLPIGRNATSAALLAPGAVRGDSLLGDGNLASFGGSSVAENQYFVNGFNITNTFNNLSFAQVPREAVAEEQVKTGGYGAEFGRSTGGILNQITKRGTNEFHFGGNIYYQPSSLYASRDNLYLNPDENGDRQLRTDRSQNTLDDTTATLWAGGALVKDRFFAYGVVQFSDEAQSVYPGVFSGGSNDTSGSQDLNYLLKLDWNISDNHTLELTSMASGGVEQTDSYLTSFSPGIDYVSAIDAGVAIRGDFLGSNFEDDTSTLNVVKYTGYLTDSLTLSALAGRGEFSREEYSVSPDGVRSGGYEGNILTGTVPGCPIVRDNRSVEERAGGPAIAGCDFVGFLPIAGAGDIRTQYRVDLEWQLGNHLLRGGIDVDNFESTSGQAYSGGAFWSYTSNNEVRLQNVRQGAVVGVDQQALYLEDSWNITDTFVAYFGARFDSFDNLNGAGESYNSISNQFAPRLGLSWDVFGDSRSKLYANAGRYALPLTATVAVRGASASLFTREFYNYSSVDPVTGVPLGDDGEPVNLDGRTDYLIERSEGLLNPEFVNNEFGQTPNPLSIAAQDLQPMYQDEFILGYEQQWNAHFSGGVRGIYRTLGAAIDDNCDVGPVYDWALANGFNDDAGSRGNQRLDPDNPLQVAFENDSFPACRLFNPGEDAIYNVDVNGDGELESVPVSAEESGFDQAVRKYEAIEFYFSGVWGGWRLNGSYTYAKSYGNTEGGVKSDNGQEDTGTTQDFDFPELGIGAYGDLPNSREQTVKIYGTYAFSDEWTIGGNLVTAKGRPQNCFGIYAADPANYANAYFSCDTGGLDADGNPEEGVVNLGGFYDNGSTIVARGTAGTLPTTTTMDLSLDYRPAFADHKLRFNMTIFNLFDSQKATAVEEEGENSSGLPQPIQYGSALALQAPRSIRFLLEYDF